MQFKKIITYKIKWMNEHTTKCWARLSTNCCTIFWRSWLRICVSTNSSIGLGSRPRVAACKEKIGWKLNILYVTTNYLTIYFIKINLTIRFACALNGTDPPVCVVTEPWIYRFRLSAPDCERRENRSEVTCSIYVVHISPEMNGGLNSRQTATSFHPSRPLSLAFLFYLFWVSYQKSRNLLP